MIFSGNPEFGIDPRRTDGATTIFRRDGTVSATNRKPVQAIGRSNYGPEAATDARDCPGGCLPERQRRLMRCHRGA